MKATCFLVLATLASHASISRGQQVIPFNPDNWRAISTAPNMVDDWLQFLPGDLLRIEAATTVPLSYAEIAVVPTEVLDLPPVYTVSVDVTREFASNGSEDVGFLGLFIGHDGQTAGRSGAGILFTTNGGALRDFRLYRDQNEQFCPGPYADGVCGDGSSPSDWRGHDSQTGPAFDALDLEIDDGRLTTIELDVDSVLRQVDVSLRQQIGDETEEVEVGTLQDFDISNGLPAIVFSDLFANAQGEGNAYAVFDNFVVTPTTTAEPGDFDGDGTYGCDDIDALIAQIASGANNLTYDLTGDQVVDLDDRDEWLAIAGAANLDSGNAYLVGDATLDGTVDGLDYIQWNDHKFTPTAAWCEGDFTADGINDGLDFISWNDHKFTTANRTAPVVPEPCQSISALFASVWLSRRRRSWACTDKRQSS